MKNVNSLFQRLFINIKTKLKFYLIYRIYKNLVTARKKKYQSTKDNNNNLKIYK